MINVIAYKCNSVNQQLFNQFYCHVSQKRRDKADKYRFQSDSIRSVCGEMLVLLAFQKAYGFCDSKLIFENGIYGKPYIRNFRQFHFNISHSGDWVVCAAANFPVGVDVELIDKAKINIADICFSSIEVKQLSEQQIISKREELFFYFWTSKESYIKCTGYGLQAPLNSFSVINNVIHIGNTKSNYHINPLYLDKKHALAVCCDKIIKPHLHIVTDNELMKLI